MGLEKRKIGLTMLWGFYGMVMFALLSATFVAPEIMVLVFFAYLCGIGLVLFSLYRAFIFVYSLESKRQSYEKLIAEKGR